MNYHDFDAMTKINDFSIESSSTKENFYFQVFLEVIKFVVMENYEFEYRIKAILLALPGGFGQPKY